MTLRRSLMTAVAAVVVLAMVATGAAARDGGTSKGSGNRLAGTWVATVVRPAPLPALQTLQVFTRSGTAIVVDNDSPATHTAQYGAWKRIHGRLYASTGVFFRFNAQGQFVGSQKINRTIELAPDGNTFKQVARVTVLDANGNVLVSFIARATAERMQIEQIPDLP